MLSRLRNGDVDVLASGEVNKVGVDTIGQATHDTGFGNTVAIRNGRGERKELIPKLHYFSLENQDLQLLHYTTNQLNGSQPLIGNAGRMHMSGPTAHRNPLSCQVIPQRST